MNENRDELSDLDPARLLPFTVEFQKEDPNAIKLPRRYYIGDRIIPPPVESDNSND